MFGSPQIVGHALSKGSKMGTELEDQYDQIILGAAASRCHQGWSWKHFAA